MKVYRLTKAKYSNDLSGKGAEVAGGRWNSKGISMLYTSQSRALCTAEIAVHVPLGIVPVGYELITIQLPTKISIDTVVTENLPAGWNSFPHIAETRLIGDQFILGGKYLALKIPSAVVQGDYNYLLNPLHKDFHLVKIIQTEPFEFDKRLFIRE